ncbi:hypothetical protein AMJ57_05710 [Parcubacteria bacterium SG8_24]|nr:MAG: hypothetical protein AMJ57_05710 [Parcubacteria bacterium SG8_24]
MEKFYVTTPIYYVNDVPHIGHFYTSLAADALARYWRMRGRDVFLLTGTDENSQKNVEAAAKRGYDDVQAYIDMMSGRWFAIFRDLGITFDGFIRTTEERHRIGVEEFWRRVESTGDIYLGEYEGLYCAGCEAFITESDLTDGQCPVHRKEPQRIKEKNYFFRLSAYRERLLEHIDAHPEFIQPVSRRNEVRSYVERFMEDISISRETMKWGIPVPGDPTQVIYVWFDALINYLTGIGFGDDQERFGRYWPADVQLVGKDIIKFHCALWPAMLMSAGIPLPKKVFAHGFFTIDGEKISKSLGNAVDPQAAAERYGIDALRFFLLREITFGEDGDFSMDRLGERYANDLANELGNLSHRVLSMTAKYFAGKVPPATDGSLGPVWDRYDQAMADLRFGAALDAIWDLLRDSNRLIDAEQPWKLAKTDQERLAAVLYTLLERLRASAWMLRPLLPETAGKMRRQLGLSEEEFDREYEAARVWGGIAENATIAKSEPLFPRRDD